MNINELKLMAIRIAELSEEGVLSIYADQTGKSLARVHLRDEVFKEFSEGREVHRNEHSGNHDEESFTEDDVTFFHLVSRYE